MSSTFGPLRAIFSGFTGGRMSPQPGWRYRETAVGAFGQPIDRIWEVESISLTSDGIPHARLRDVTDPTRSRFIAVSVLLDRAYYTPVSQQDVR